MPGLTNEEGEEGAALALPSAVPAEAEPAEDKPPQGISLLAQILVKAREERKKKEEEEAQKNKDAAVKLIEDKKKKANSIKGRCKVLVKKLVIYPDS